MKDDFQLVACVHPVQGQANEVTCHVQLRPPEATERTPLDVVCVVDTSGSMCVNASLQGADGGELENDNLEVRAAPRDHNRHVGSMRRGAEQRAPASRSWTWRSTRWRP